MKKYILCLIVFIEIVSCREEAVPKPDNLLSKQQMADVLYDITVINSMKGVDKRGLEASILHFDTYLYKKHNIDSVQFTSSNNYYASNPLQYNKIYGLVVARLEKERTIVEAEMKKEQERKDSLQKAKKQEIAKQKKLKDTVPKPKFKQVNNK